MGIASVWGFALVGIDAVPVRVEAHARSGLPGVTIVGLPGAAVREARERAPGGRDIRHHLAWALARKGLKEEARAELASAFRASGEFESEPEARRLHQEIGG